MSRVLSMACWMGLAGVVLSVGAAAAAEDPALGPQRQVVAAFEYPGRIITSDRSVELKLVLKNNGRQDETVFLSVTEQPPGWESHIEHFSDRISGVFLASGEKKTLDFRADLKDRPEDQDLEVGEYRFTVNAATEDQQLQSVARGVITVRARTPVAKDEGADTAKEPVRLTTSYPSLRGATDSTFEFSIDVHNDTDKDAMFTLRSEQPEGWDVAFKPGYENKYIGTFQIKANLSQSIKVEVKPTPRADAGEYPIRVIAESPQGQAAIDLTVTLTGTHKLTCRTLNGVLSLSTRKGRDGNISFYVVNDGSAREDGITFTSFKPENWEVSFSPERIDTIEPGGMKQVEVTISPASEALVGDYSVSISTQGQGTTDDLELRVTVKASAAWGWIGVAVIVIVVAALGWTFKKLGRR